MKVISAIPLNSILHSWYRFTHRIPTLSFCSILFLLLVAEISCKKSRPPANILPPVTEEGKNTFGCKINGEVWIPFYQCGLIEIPNHCKELQSVVTSADSTGKIPIDFELSVERELKTGGGSFSAFYIGATIRTTGSVGNFFNITFIRDSVSYGPQYPISAASNAIVITKLDTVNKIISGTINCTLYGPYGPANGDSVVVTDGRFDVRYNACLCH